MRDGTKFIFRLAAVVLLVLAIPSSGSVSAQTPTGTVGIFYIGPEDAIAEAIDQASPYIVRVDRTSLAQVIVINNSPVAGTDATAAPGIAVETLREYGSQVRQPEMGLVVFCGEDYPQSLTDLSSVLGVGAFGLGESRAAAEITPGADGDRLQEAVAWSTAPAIAARTLITNPNLLIPVVSTASQEPVLHRVRGRESGQILIMGAWLSDASNAEWQDWPYYRYLIYRMIMDAGNSAAILDFSDYPVSTVPPGPLRMAIAGASTALVGGTGALFYLARRRLFLHPGDTPEPAGRRLTLQPVSDWDVAGFHRPLAGALAFVFFGVLLVFPLIAYETPIVPGLLFPNRQVYDAWAMVTRWMMIVWALLDFGTGTAATWYFATTHQRYPQQAYRYFQFYVWWQLLTGAAFAAVLGAVIAFVLPQTSIAHLAYYLAIYGLLSVPRILTTFQLYFRALQRLDYERMQVLVVSSTTVILQIGCVMGLRWWGARFPAIGHTIGSVLGFGIGMYLAQWIGFFVGMVQARRAGYPIRELFRPRYSAAAASAILRYGGQLTFGQVAVPIGVLVETTLIARWGGRPWVIDWLALALFAGAYEYLLHGLYRGLMPAMAVAISYEAKTLQRSYVSLAWRYSSWLSLLLFAVLYAIGPRLLVHGLGVSSQNSLRYLAPLLAWGALRWNVGLADRVFEAAKRPATPSWLTIGEVVLRIGTAMLLTPLLELGGLVVSYFIALAARSLVEWVWLQRIGLGSRIYIWQSFIAPGGSALLVYNLLRLADEQLALTGPQSVMLWSIAATLIGLMVHGFLTGVLGGWDEAGIREFERATRISGSGTLPARIMLQIIRGGTRLSPLRERYPIRLQAQANEEARAITYSRPPTT